MSLFTSWLRYLIWLIDGMTKCQMCTNYKQALLRLLFMLGSLYSDSNTTFHAGCWVTRYLWEAAGFWQGAKGCQCHSSDAVFAFVLKFPSTHAQVIWLLFSCLERSQAPRFFIWAFLIHLLWPTKKLLLKINLECSHPWKGEQIVSGALFQNYPISIQKRWHWLSRSSLCRILIASNYRIII